MSRWEDQFKNHPFQNFWKQILDDAEDLIADNQSVTTDVEEVARCKKVISYIQELFESCDYELVPTNIWQNFQTQSQHCATQLQNYKNNRNISHLQSANAHLDNLLSYIMPFVKDGRSAARASTMAFKTYEKTIKEHLATFKSDATELLSNIETLSKKSKESNDYIEEVKNSVDNLDIKLFQGKEDYIGLEQQIDELKQKIESTAESIETYAETVLDDRSGSDSIEYQIRECLNQSNTNSESISDLLDESKSELEKLRDYYYKIFGKKDEDGNLVLKGLKSEIEERKKELDEFDSHHRSKHGAFIEEIESLIPGATTAGLATAYKELKNTAENSITKYSVMFLCSIFVLFMLSTSFVVKDFTLSPFNISYMELKDWNDTLKLAIQRLPFVIPIIWLTMFASNRRSEFQRLQQEFAHKEATAKSYQSFKKQISELDEDEKHKELLVKLLDAAIEAVAFNASGTLDKKNGDKTPIHASLEKLTTSVDKLITSKSG